MCQFSYGFTDDREVTVGGRSNAYISWCVPNPVPFLLLAHIISRFFTLAHEIAHNLVLQHNSEHEFYFSSICEKYVGSLARMLV